MTHAEIADLIESLLKQHRGGCLCTLRESCERCSSYGVAANLEREMRGLANVLRSTPDTPPPYRPEDDPMRREYKPRLLGD